MLCADSFACRTAFRLQQSERRKNKFMKNSNVKRQTEMNSPNQLTFPNWPKNVLISSSLISDVRPPTKILPWRAFAFFGSTFLLLMTCSATAVTFSIASGDLYTMNAKPRDRPVCGSVLTLMLSISPYCPKCSRNSSANCDKHWQQN